MKILQSKMTETQTSFPTNFGGELMMSFIPSFLFFLSASTAATYIFTAPTSNNYYN
jgi:hypothetical protein